MRVRDAVFAFCLGAAAAGLPTRVATVSAMQSDPSKRLTNAEVIELVKSGLTPDLVIAAIRKATAKNFDTSVDGLKALNDAKVPKDVIRFMITGKEEGLPGAAATEGERPSSSVRFKPGLWDMHAIHVGVPIVRGVAPKPDSQARRVEYDMDMCWDQGFGGEHFSGSAPDESGGRCMNSTERPKPGTVVTTLQCEYAGLKGIWTTRYEQINEEHAVWDTKMTTQGVVSGNAHARPDETMHSEMTWKGLCPVGMKPGDHGDPRVSLPSMQTETTPK